MKNYTAGRKNECANIEGCWCDAGNCGWFVDKDTADGYCNYFNIDIDFYDYYISAYYKKDWPQIDRTAVPGGEE